MSDLFEQAGEVPEDVLRLAEAYVFASPDPVAARTLAPLLPPGQNAHVVLEALQGPCARRGVVLAEVNGTWAFRTAPDLADRLRLTMAPRRGLPRVAVEVLALIALHQPVTRPEIEGMRGVSLRQASIDVLLDAGLIRPAGRREAPGRPTLWATTPRFLAQFGLRSLHDLPGAGLALPAGQGRDLRRPQTAARLAVLMRPDRPCGPWRRQARLTRDNASLSRVSNLRIDLSQLAPQTRVHGAHPGSRYPSPSPAGGGEPYLADAARLRAERRGRA